LQLSDHYNAQPISGLTVKHCYCVTGVRKCSNCLKEYQSSTLR